MLSINMSSPLSSAQFMFWFGAGTLLLMLIATLSSGFAGPVIRRRINRAMPYLMVCLGFWFILRGLNLGIPHLSPAKPATGSAVCK